MLAQLDYHVNGFIDIPNDDKMFELNLTQLIKIQNNISQTLIQLDDRINYFFFYCNAIKPTKSVTVWSRSVVASSLPGHD